MRATREHGTKTRAWDLAGRVYHEALLRGQEAAAGSNQARLVEKLEKNPKYVARQARTIQIMGSFYLLTVAVLPVTSLVATLQGETLLWNAFLSSTAATAQLIVQTAYLMLLTLLATAELLSPDLFDWPSSLPISTVRMGTLRLVTLAREFLLPVCVIVLAYPIVSGLISRSIVVGLVALLFSSVHAVATVSLIVLASRRMYRTLRTHGGANRRAQITRVITMLAYGVGALVIVFAVQVGTNTLTGLVDEPRMTAAATTTVTRILAALPLPSSGATLITELTLRRNGISTSNTTLLISIAGTLLYGVATFLFAHRVRRQLGRFDAPAASGAPAAGRATHAELLTAAAQFRVRTPRATFARQIFQSATRDTQVLMSIIMPLLIPTIATIGPMLSGAPGPVVAIIGPGMAAVMSGWILIHGLTRLEIGAGQLTATLPALERDRAFPRLWIAGGLPVLGSLLASLLLQRFGSGEQLRMITLSLVAGVAVPVGLLVKVLLFGRVSNRTKLYVIEEVRTDARFWKWVATVASMVAAAAALAIPAVVLQARLSAGYYYGGYAALLVAGFGGVALVSARVFPPRVDRA